jgi:hypothetical protein
MEHHLDDLARLLDEHHGGILLVTSSTDLSLDLGRQLCIQVPLGFYSANCEIVRNPEGILTKAPTIL